MDKEGKVSFTLLQIRLICREKGLTDPLAGSGTAIYPQGRMIEKELAKDELDKILSFSRNDFQSKKPYGRAAWMDVAFKVPPGLTPAFIQFKQNTIVELPKPVTSTPEIEKQLNGEE